MKELKLYVCEHCHTQYADKKEAERCEKSHKWPLAVKTCRFRSRKEDNTGLPVSVTLTFENGKETVEAVYKR